jgi:hypothetical protein
LVSSLIAAAPTSPKIPACERADITVTMRTPMTSGAKSNGRSGAQNFVYRPTEDVWRCPAGEKLACAAQFAWQDRKS